jgi:hypothetical protein
LSKRSKIHVHPVRPGISRARSDRGLSIRPLSNRSNEQLFE